MSTSSNYDDASDSDEDEEECRVCRGPAEPGRPLFKPCKCSGSIGLTHQDCLTSWLEVTHGDGRCELCSTKFKFAPQYASGTPDRLPSREVCYRILRRFGAKWLPRALRALFAAGLWLVVLPLSTSYIYHGWMHRPSAIASRWSWELAKTDTVGGAVIAIIIVVSFLSLMSFAEFLRFQWGGGGGGAGGQQPQQGQQQQQRRGAGERRGRNNNGGNNRANNREGGAAGGAPIEGEIDDIVLHHHPDDNVEVDPLVPFINHLMAGGEDSVDGDYGSIDTDSDGGEGRRGGEDHGANANDIPGTNEVHEGEHDGDHGHLPPPIDDEEDQLEAFMRAQEDQEMMDGDDHHRQHRNDAPDPVRNWPEADHEDANDVPDFVPQQPPLREVNVPNANPRPREDARFEPQFEPLRPAFEGADMDAQDDGPEMEINVALDELLGFRGPLLALIRNLLWLLIFNTAYLGVFAFTPLKFGGSVYELLSKMLPNFDAVLPGNLWENFITSMQELDRKSNESNLIYQPSQIAKMGLGYASFSILIFVLQAALAVALRRRERQAASPNGAIGGAVRDDPPILDGVERVADQNIPFRENNPFRDDEAPGKRILGFLECAGAIAKVVILLLIKMLFLPLLLGIWLDWATLSLFEKTWSDRIEYAGSDLFGSTFLHWVTGITFMLLVTVSVLQLREVAHPDILAGVIRPQEPQPDLLGNLLQESGATHTKRVLLSLGIYAVLLAVHIWIPTRLLMMSNLGQYLPLFRPKFWHVIMPQIQVPLELFIFHLCMLGVLEKYKNNIGEMQHHWLILIGNYLGITDQILPHEVDRFLLVGSLPVFVEDASSSQLENPGSVGEVPSVEGRNDDIYPLWNSLLSETDLTKRAELIRSNICRIEPMGVPRYTYGIVQRNGKKLLSSHAYIRLPLASSTSRLIVKTTNDASSNLLPTSIGPYRLRQGVSAGKHKGAKISMIEVWREVAGKPIPRPPEGWDDLGVGGAERHGRWAWGNEHTSEIESSVAVRTPFFNDPAASRRDKISPLAHLTAKMMLLLFISWVAISVVVCAVLNIPLHLGRSAMFFLRVPDNRIHDPLAFAIGISLLVPMVGVFTKLLAASNNGVRGVVSLLQNRVRSFKRLNHRPHEKDRTLSTFFALWLVVCPALLGFIYYSFVVGIRGEMHDWYDHAYVALVNWGTGTLLLNGWAAMCYFQMFTKRFWTAIVVGDGQGNANENQDPGLVEARPQGVDHPGRNADRQGNNLQETDAVEPNELTWQGKDGAIARAFESIRAVILGWEWDKVDKRKLLLDCAFPVLRHLAIPFAVLIMAVAFVAPLVDAAGRQIGTTAMFRIFATVSTVIDIFNSSKRSLTRWFEVAHKVARDDRYLVGEILLNYSPLRESTPA